MKVSEIIDCTCTVASISGISRFAWANMWSVRVFTSDIYVTFVGVRFAFVNICQKKEKKEKRMKNWFWFLFKSHKCTFIWKKCNIRLQFFGFMRFSGWTCKSNRYFRNFFTLLQQRPSKAYAINYSCFPTGAQNTLYKQKRENELKNKSSTTAFPCYSEFTCAILSISSISRLTIAYMWSIGVGAVCILVTRVVSFTLVNVYEITDKKLCKIAVHKPLPC